jgi:TP901 family phage tail tape measure protein
LADRTTRVTLTAQVTGYIDGMRRAAEETKKTGTEAEKLAAKREAFTQLGTAALAVGTLAAAGVALAISKFAEFDQAMSYVAAATHESAENMKLLRDAALDAGARTVFSATEAANAIEELSKAGVSTADILNGGLDGALDLAAAGGLAVADAAGIAAVALKTFGLEGSDMAHVADLLAAGAGKAMGDVTDLSAALNQSAQVAKNTGLSIEETTAALSAFASQGLLGSDAGTSFKSMLQRLTPQSAEAEAKMKELGISAYDAQGQFIGLSAFAGNLQESLKSLTPEQRNSAMATIFGSDAVRAATVLYSEGADGIKDWEKAVNDQGYAAETAAMRLDNLAGDIETLGGAIDTALIQTGSAGNDVLRFMVQTLTEVVDAYNNVPEPIKAAILLFGGLGAAVGLAGGAFLIGVPRVAAYQAALATLGPTAQRVGAAMSTALGPVGIALAGATIILGAFIGKQAEAAAQTKELTDTLDDQTGAFTEATRAAVTKRLEDEGVYEAAKRAGISLKDVTDAAMGNADAYEKVSEKASSWYQTLNFTERVVGGGSIAYDKLTNNIRGTSDSLDAAKTSFENQAEAAEGSGEATLAAGDQYLAAAEEATTLGDQLAELLTVMNEINKVGQDAVSANADWLESLQGIRSEFESNFIEKQKDAYIAAHGSLDGYTESLKGFSVSLDENTVAGSANAAALADIAAKAQEAAAKQYEVDKTTMSAKDATDKYVATLGSSRQSLIDQAIANGANADEVQRLADKIFALPSQKEVDVLVDTANATRQINEWVAIQNGKQVHIAVGAGGAGGITKADGGIVDYYANGGIRENHVAQIAPAGSYRVWAEQETGGESYIPLAPSKREQSLAIWAETGRRLGAAMFADGSPLYASSGSSSPFQAVTPDIYVQVTNPWTGEVLLQRASQIADSKVKQSAVQRRTALENGVRR